MYMYIAVGLHRTGTLPHPHKQVYVCAVYITHTPFPRRVILIYFHIPLHKFPFLNSTYGLTHSCVVQPGLHKVLPKHLSKSLLSIYIGICLLSNISLLEHPFVLKFLLHTKQVMEVKNFLKLLHCRDQHSLR